MTKTKTFRLSEPDERDVRWGLAQDMKGDLGLRSSFEAFLNTMNLRSKLVPFVEKDPPRTNRGGLDLRDHVSQVMECASDDHRTLLTYEMSTETTAAAERSRFVLGAFALLGAYDLATLQRCYRDVCPKGLEAWDDVGPLVVDTKASRRVDGGGFVSLIGLSSRVRAEGGPSEQDREVWAAIYAEADEKLSAACRAYTRAGAEMRQARRLEQVQEIIRRKRAR